MYFSQWQKCKVMQTPVKGKKDKQYSIVIPEIYRLLMDEMVRRLAFVSMDVSMPDNTTILIAPRDSMPYPKGEMKMMDNLGGLEIPNRFIHELEAQEEMYIGISGGRRLYCKAFAPLKSPDVRQCSLCINRENDHELEVYGDLLLCPDCVDVFSAKKIILNIYWAGMLAALRSQYAAMDEMLEHNHDEQNGIKKLLVMLERLPLYAPNYLNPFEGVKL